MSYSSDPRRGPTSADYDEQKTCPNIHYYGIYDLSMPGFSSLPSPSQEQAMPSEVFYNRMALGEDSHSPEP